MPVYCSLCLCYVESPSLSALVHPLFRSKPKMIENPKCYSCDQNKNEGIRSNGDTGIGLVEIFFLTSCCVSVTGSGEIFPKVYREQKNKLTNAIQTLLIFWLWRNNGKLFTLSHCNLMEWEMTAQKRAVFTFYWAVRTMRLSLEHWTPLGLEPHMFVEWHSFPGRRVQQSQAATKILTSSVSQCWATTITYR